MPPRKADLSPIQQVSQQYLAYIALTYAYSKQDLAAFYSLEPYTNAQHLNMLNFHYYVLSKCKQAELSYQTYFIVAQLILTYFSTDLSTYKLQHLTMTVFSSLQRVHEHFSVETYEQTDEFDEFHAKGSVKEALSAAEVYSNISLIGKLQVDPKKPVKIVGIVLSEAQAASCCAICGFYLSKRQLFYQAFSYTPSQISGLTTVSTPFRPYCKDLCKLSEGVAFKKPTKQELLIREAVIEKAHEMWEEIRQKVEAK